MSWVSIGPLAALPKERAVPARVGQDQVALVRLDDDSVHAVGNLDPYSGAQVMARGIVGSICVEGAIHRTIASPMYKQTFYLTTGASTADEAVRLGVWRVRVADGQVFVGDRVEPASAPAVSA